MSYNGWTNYATWRVNLEMVDGLDPRDMGWDRLDHHDLMSALKDYANELIEMDVKESLALDYARAFLADVNWWEIAQHLIDDYDLAESCE